MGTTINDSTDSNKGYSYEALRKNLLEATEFVEEHIGQLEKLAGILARRASNLTRISMAIKVIVIFLGALSATSGTSSALGKFFDPVFYTIVGLSIATISGLDAAFKFEARSSGRRLLAGTVSAKIYEYKSDINKLLRRCMVFYGKSEISEAEFVKFLDETNKPVDEIVMFINDVFQKASDLGVNLKLDQIKYSQEENRLNNPDSTSTDQSRKDIF